MNKLIFPLLIGTTILLGAILISGAILSNTSSISHLVKWIGLGLSIVCFVKPKLGIYIVITEAFVLDYVKKVAVYYGNVSQQTIIEVMFVVMSALMCCYIGRIIQHYLGNTARMNLSKLELALYLVFAIFAFFTFYLELDQGFIGAGQAAFNGGVYLGISGLIYGLFREKEEILALLKYSLWLALVWVLVAIKQNFIGFSDIEWFYAKTGLSPVSTKQMLLTLYENPRPFGLGSGAPNFTALIPYLALATALLFHKKNISSKLFYLIVISMFMIGSIISQIKTMIILSPVIAIVSFFIHKKYIGTLIILTGLFFCSLIVFFSKEILDNLENYNYLFLNTFNLSSEWSILTFSDRLKIFIEITEANNWQLIGGETVTGHSFVVESLIKLGILPSAILLFFIIGSIFYIKNLLKNSDHKMRYLAAVCLVSFLLSGSVKIITGHGLYSQPTSGVLGLFLGCFLSLVYETERKNRLSTR